MDTFLSRYPMTAALLALSALLLVVIGFETGWGSQLRPALPGTGPVKTAAVEAKLLPPLAPSTPEQAYPETGSRPLFTPTRRPAPQAATAANMVKGQYTLQGVTIVGDLRIAMLKEKQTGKTVRAEKGRDLNGMSVAEIEPDRVTLRLGDDSELLTLTVQRGGGPGAAATPAPAAGPFPGTAAPPAAAARPAAPAAGSPPGSPPGSAPSTPVRAPLTPGASASPPVTTGIPGPIPSGSAAMPVAGDSGAAPAPGAAASPLTPEEILARRRARRTQPGQQ